MTVGLWFRGAAGRQINARLLRSPAGEFQFLGSPPAPIVVNISLHCGATAFNFFATGNTAIRRGCDVIAE